MDNDKDKSSEKLDSVDLVDMEGVLDGPENENKTPGLESPMVSSEANVQLLKDNHFRVRM